MARRSTLLPERRLRELRSLLDSRIHEMAQNLAGEDFAECFDVLMCKVFADGVAQTRADEGTIWLLNADRTHLIPCYNTGPRAADFVYSFQQDLRTGMISMVLATELPICENEVHKSEEQDRSLDNHLQVATCAMIAVPFYLSTEVKGVLSAVQLCRTGRPEPEGFAPESLQVLQDTGSILTRMLEHRLLQLCLGTEMAV